jgi:hypothetical protein
MQAARWSLGAQQVSSRSGEFRVTGADEAATTTASQAFAADIAAALGEDFHYCEAADNLDTRFIADKKKRSGLAALIGVAILSAATLRTSASLIAPGQVRISPARSGKEKRAGAKRRPAREELSTPDASARDSKPVREPMAARVASACSPYVGIPGAAREIVPPRGLGGSAPIGRATRLRCRTRKSRRCGSPDEPWRPKWRRRAFP